MSGQELSATVAAATHRHVLARWRGSQAVAHKLAGDGHGVGLNSGLRL